MQAHGKKGIQVATAGCRAEQLNKERNQGDT